MKKDRPVVKALLMISQIGISMIVPIFLGAFLGYHLDGWLGTGFFFLVFLLFGILAAFRNIYKLTKPFYAEDLKREKKEQAYWESLKKGRVQDKKADLMDSVPDAPDESGGQGKSAVSAKAAEEDGGKQPDGPAARRRRQQLLLECAPADSKTAPKSRREAAEEEFAAWRREREKVHDDTGDAKDG